MTTEQIKEDAKCKHPLNKPIAAEAIEFVGCGRFLDKRESDQAPH
ncbi:hypothetical protein [Sulfuricurvum sp. IAE1]|nr:hypothetical protein [Sulfuricurvum sp. IAE1]